MCKYGYKTENARFGMRAAIAKQVRGDAALRTVPLFRISVGFGAGRVLVRGAQRRACIKTSTRPVATLPNKSQIYPNSTASFSLMRKEGEKLPLLMCIRLWSRHASLSGV